ncbi:MAG: MIP/aquaporin family protein [Chloroflexota bacterium]
MEPFVAELLGTAMLIILGNGVVANVVLRESKGSDSGWIVITAGWGFAVFIAVFMIGQYSGAHINPAVTIGLAVNESFGEEFFTGWEDVPVYIIAQMIGAFLGAVIVWLTYKLQYDATEDKGSKLATFSTAPAIRNPVFNLITEAVGTFVLVFGVFTIVPLSAELSGVTGTEGAVFAIDAGALGAFPVGILVFGIGLSLGGPTGYAINPARDLGPRIAHFLLPISGKGDSDWGYSWIPVVGPVIGAVLAALAYGALV